MPHQRMRRDLPQWAHVTSSAVAKVLSQSLQPPSAPHEDVPCSPPAALALCLRVLPGHPACALPGARGGGGGGVRGQRCCGVLVIGAVLDLVLCR